jgi:hypothetical protein
MTKKYRHLAKDELESITEDKWDEDIWGLEHEDAVNIVEIPKLIFYFGAHASLPSRYEIGFQLTDSQDHWVANNTRDTLIAARGKRKDCLSSKPIMLVDENGIGHEFCISEFLLSGI